MGTMKIPKYMHKKWEGMKCGICRVVIGKTEYSVLIHMLSKHPRLMIGALKIGWLNRSFPLHKK